MNILSLFDGISCGRVAIERVGINVDKYYASEVDKYAIKISSKNYPDIIQLGDVNHWQDWDIDWSSIDLLIGGSPCQGFSNAGKGLNFKDPRSALFFVYVDILNHIIKQNPKVMFLLENVKMKKEWVNIISKYLGVEPVEINSSLVSAQNRQRYYWTNIAEIQQPEDKHIYLKDILITNNTIRIPEYGNEDKSRPLTCHYSNNFGGWYDRITDPNPNKQQIDILAQPLNATKDNKAHCIKAQYYKNNIANFVTNKGFDASGVAEPIILQRPHGFNNGGFKTKKAPTLTSGASYEQNNFVCEPIKYLNEKNVQHLMRDFGSKGKILSYKDYKTNTLTASMGMGGGNGLYYAEQGTGKNIFEVKDKKIIIYGKEYTMNLEDGLWYFRKLTPIECERLQTLPDNYTDGVSNTQRYKCLGNGWTVDVIAHIFSYLLKQGEKNEKV